MKKYYKNLILCGDIDFHCLPCEETFHYVADIDRHIRWESHRKKVTANIYLPKFQEDFILKINNFYYCEVCNLVLPTALKTTLHTNDENHIVNKTNSAQNIAPQNTISRDAENIKISTDIIVNEKEWNGVVDDQCIICDKDIDDIETHITETKHVINLIQSRVELQNPERIYRKIPGEIFYCFSCKAPLPISLLEKHWISKEHSKQNKTTSAVNNAASTSGSPQTFSNEFKNNMKKMFIFSEAGNKTNETADKGNSDILLHLREFQNGGIDINFERSTAVCKVCKFAPAFTFQAIDGHIKMHKKAENSPDFSFSQLAEDIANMSDDDEEWTTEESESDDYSDMDSSGGDTIVEEEAIAEEDKENHYTGSVSDFVKMKSELRNFGKQNYMKLVADGTKGYCTLCDTYVSSHIKNFTQHVKGAKHVGNSKAKNKPEPNSQNGNQEPEYKTKTLRDYLRNIFYVKQMDDFWINRTHCIDTHSFFIVCHQENNGKYDKIKCFICNDVFPADKDQAHCKTDEHKKKMFNTKVVVSLKKEFVREILPNTFHCGFCNEVSAGWDLMKKHLKTRKHREFRMQQGLVAGMTHDMYGMHMEDTNSAETDIMWMQLMGNRLF